MRTVRNDWPPEGRENLPERFWNTALYPTAEDAYNAFYDSDEFRAMAAEADRDTIQNPSPQRGPRPVKMDVAKEAAKAGMDTTAFVRALAGVESDFNYRAQNPSSTAVGAHQFLWKDLKRTSATVSVINYISGNTATIT